MHSTDRTHGIGHRTSRAIALLLCAGAVAVHAGCSDAAGPRPFRLLSGSLAGPGEGEGEGEGDEPPPSFVPAAARMRRLLSFQYQNAIADILGSAAAATVTPPADVTINGFFAVGAATLSMQPSDIELVESNAFAAAQVAVHGGAAQAWRTCTPAAFDDATCMQNTVQNLGRKAFRRPLTAQETTRWTDVAMNAAAAYGDFDLGLEFAVAGLLQSPYFLYLVEVGVPVAGGDPARLRLSGLELASRLSFFILGTTPSDDVLDAAERGDLDGTAGMHLYVDAMLQDGRARAATSGYFDERLQLSVMLQQDRNDPAYTPAIQQAMREETLRFLGDIVWDRNADAREMFSADFTYLNDALATYYALPLPGSGAQFARVTLDPVSKRGGVLSQGAVLSRFAHDDRSSPTLRGKFVREALMCQGISAPPNDVDTSLPPPADNATPRTTRQRIADHMTQERCASCHSTMDPIGFALEAFDGAGRLRTQEVGLPIDDTGDLDGTAVQGAIGLGARLKDDATVPGCLVRNLFRHATGHIEEVGEDPSLDLVTNAFEDSGYRVQDALRAIVLSDAFRYVAAAGGAP